jgi:hypothetical protein
VYCVSGTVTVGGYDDTTFAKPQEVKFELAVAHALGIAASDVRVVSVTDGSAVAADAAGRAAAAEAGADRYGAGGAGGGASGRDAAPAMTDEMDADGMQVITEP